MTALVMISSKRREKVPLLSCAFVFWYEGGAPTCGGLAGFSGVLVLINLYMISLIIGKIDIEVMFLNGRSFCYPFWVVIFDFDLSTNENLVVQPWSHGLKVNPGLAKC